MAFLLILAQAHGKNSMSIDLKTMLMSEISIKFSIVVEDQKRDMRLEFKNNFGICWMDNLSVVLSLFSVFADNYFIQLKTSLIAFH